VLTQGGTPFSVFTPYKNAWLRASRRPTCKPLAGRSHGGTPRPAARRRPPAGLAELGFVATDLAALRLPTGMSGAQAMFRDFAERIDDYAAKRDYPAQKGCSYLSAHLRFGTISIRQLAAYAHAQPSRGAATWLSELIWRDFYHAILWHHPRVVQNAASSPNSTPCAGTMHPSCLPRGRPGAPATRWSMPRCASSMQAGWMHNRLRMVTASFLTKDLGIDWRRGEAWFAEKLLDFDLAANNGGWQWAASTGCDAQPWFRIFNPVTQSEKFDPEGRFIRRYVPELARCQPNSSTRRGPWTLRSGGLRRNHRPRLPGAGGRPRGGAGAHPADDAGVMNRSVAETGGEILAVSQFTLYASTKKGNRPSWGRAARGEVSQPLFEGFVTRLSAALGRPVATGVFGADMQVSLVNDGPVTVAIDSRNPQ
jgi:deoxyribodipyrimidine photo-lyase